MRVVAFALVMVLLGAGCVGTPRHRRANQTLAGLSALAGLGLLVAAGSAENDCDETQDQCDSPSPALVALPASLLAFAMAGVFLIAASADDAKVARDGSRKPTATDVANARAIEDVIAWNK